MTHGKKWKISTHFRHECDERSEIQDEKTRRSTVRVQKSVQIFKKWSKSSYTCLWTKEIIFRNEQEGKRIDATKKIRRLGDEVENTLPEFNTAELGANPPVNPTCCFKEQNTIKNLSGCHRHCRMLSRTKHCLDALVIWERNSDTKWRTVIWLYCGLIVRNDILYKSTRPEASNVEHDDSWW